MSKMNRLANSKNPYQGKNQKVLCVCSAGLLRSPTMAWVLSQAPFNYNTRAAGISEEFALILVDDVLIEWADEIVCADREHVNHILTQFPQVESVVCLDLPDQYQYRDPELVDLIFKRYMESCDDPVNL